MTRELEAETSEVQYVGFWVRFLAFVLDSTVASIAIAPLVVTLIGETSVDDYDQEDLAQMLELLQRLTLQLSLDLVFMGSIFILFWIIKSATPGKMLFRSSIVDAATLGKASVSQNIVRYFGYYISLVPFGIGFLWIAFDPRKQGWHDKLARTVVIKGVPRDTASNKENRSVQ